METDRAEAKVLIVDDEKNIRRTLGMVLGEAVTIGFSDGRDCICALISANSD